LNPAQVPARHLGVVGAAIERAPEAPVRRHQPLVRPIGARGIGLRRLHEIMPVDADIEELPFARRRIGHGCARERIHVAIGMHRQHRLRRSARLERLPVVVVEPEVSEILPVGVTGTKIQPVEHLGQDVPFRSIVRPRAPEIMPVGRRPRAIEGALGPLRGELEVGESVDAGNQVQVGEALHQLFPVIEPHLRVAVVWQCLAPAPIEPDGLFDQLRLVQRLAQPHEAGDDLPEDHRTRRRAPAGHVRPRRRQPGLPAETLEQHVFVEPAIGGRRFQRLVAIARGQELDGAIAEFARKVGRHRCGLFRFAFGHAACALPPLPR
jgi:hypothetical protein